jgi:hypothetical protein
VTGEKEELTYIYMHICKTYMSTKKERKRRQRRSEHVTVENKNG